LALSPKGPKFYFNTLGFPQGLNFFNWGVPFNTGSGIGGVGFNKGFPQPGVKGLFGKEQGPGLKNQFPFWTGRHRHFIFINSQPLGLVAIHHQYFPNLKTL